MRDKVTALLPFDYTVALQKWLAPSKSIMRNEVIWGNQQGQNYPCFLHSLFQTDPQENLCLDRTTMTSSTPQDDLQRNDDLSTFWTETVAQVLPCSPTHPLQNSSYWTLVLVLPWLLVLRPMQLKLLLRVSMSVRPP